MKPIENVTPAPVGSGHLVSPSDGGPAFPVPMVPYMRPDEFCDVQSTGMSLRDYFAGQSLAGQMASLSNQDNIASVSEMARWAYTLADAMVGRAGENDRMRIALKDIASATSPSQLFADADKQALKLINQLATAALSGANAAGEPRPPANP